MLPSLREARGGAPAGGGGVKSNTRVVEMDGRFD